MDKSWMQACRKSPEYLKGVNEFIEFAFNNPDVTNGKIRCPCVLCNNVLFEVKDNVKFHLLRKGIVPSYTKWYLHGETEFDEEDEELYEEFSEDEELDEEFDESEHPLEDTVVEEQQGEPFLDNMVDMLVDGLGIPNPLDDPEEEPNQDAKKFFRLVKDAETTLYPGCTNFSKLSFLVKLLNLKCRSGLSNGAFTELLEILIDAFPMVNDTLPSSYYEARKFIKELGLDYEKIDVCPNFCTLYWKDNKNLDECPICKVSRWSISKDGTCSTSRKKIAVKSIRYFPLAPRLQRLFMSPKTADKMRWHSEGRTKDGVLRHPADSEAWRKLDEAYPWFGSEARNIRLGLSSDGFNPFGTMSSKHSTWPVILTPYNLPPWLCMKKPFMILSTLIPGPKSPGDKIDVCLQPLIDELKELWEEGIETFDALRIPNVRKNNLTPCIATPIQLFGTANQNTMLSVKCR